MFSGIKQHKLQRLRNTVNSTQDLHREKLKTLKSDIRLKLISKFSAFPIKIPEYFKTNWFQTDIEKWKSMNTEIILKMSSELGGQIL